MALLAVAAEEGELGDEKWQKIAQAFVDRMGFGEQGEPLIVEVTADGGAESGESIRRNPDYVPGCRWVAVHHGVREKGNDHIHIAVNLIREDGTKANTFRDFSRARDLCRELEREFDLMPLNPNEYELARSHARGVGGGTSGRGRGRGCRRTPAVGGARRRRTGAAGRSSVPDAGGLRRREGRPE